VLKLLITGSTLPLPSEIGSHIENLLELSDKMDARGLLNCDLRITGSFANPQLQGSANLQKAFFVINDIFLRNGTISLSCNGNNINILQAEFIDTKKKKINITGNGKFFFDNLIPNIKTNLQLKCNNFTLFDSDNMKIVIAGTGSITGNINDLLISGNIDVPMCRIQKMESADTGKDNDIVINNEINVEKNSEESQETDFCKYNIDMRCPKIDIVGNVFQMLLSGNLRLSSYENKATLIGSLKIMNGRLDLFGKRLEMTKGSVEFLEQYPFDPGARFMCKRNVGDMIVYLEIKNQPKKGISLDLSSVPSYSQDAILSYILFGKELKYLSMSEAAQLAHAVASFKRKGYIFSILNTFQNIGIIDSISFANTNNKSSSLYTNNQTSYDQNNMNISAGKYVRDNLYISVNKNSDNSASFDVDFSLTSKISVKANTNGEAGISWKYRY
jgi:translocation and assembly module TamB